MKNKPYALFISSNLPSLEVPQAGHKVAFSTLKDLSLEYRVVLVSFQNNFEKQYANLNDLEFCEHVEIISQTRIGKLKNILLNLLLPVRVATRNDEKVTNLIQQLKSRYNFNLIHFHFTTSMVYSQLFPHEYKEVCEQDITYQSIFRKYKESNFFLKSLYFYFEYKRFKKWELKNLNFMDKIIVLNQKDAQLLADEAFSSSKIKIVAPYINPIFSNALQNKREKFSLLFWGAMNRIENEDAMDWFIEKIYPKVKEAVPDVKLYIVGANPSAKTIAYSKQDESIKVTGFVENPIEYFEISTLAIVPLRLGAGVKIKVLESLAAGLKVITTDVGAEGIQNINNNMIIANTIETFVHSIILELTIANK